VKYPDWWLDACRLRVGLLKRPQPQVPHLTKPKYAEYINKLDQFAAWLLWFEGGRKGQRPKFDLPVPKWAWKIEDEYDKAHPLNPKPPPTPPPPPPPSKPPSWNLPSPLVMSGVYGDNDWYGDHKSDIGTLAQIVVPGVCPLWRCDTLSGPPRTGWLAQIEGEDQLGTALELLADKPAGDSKAIVGTGNVKADRMLAEGVNVAFYELNAQASWEPYGNTNKILFQGHQDGWPYVYPSYGVYVPVSLQDYAEYHPQVTDDGGQTWYTSPTPQGIAPYYAIFSGQGMGDTDSWRFLSTL
jgi:hypothetical protein